MLLPLVLNLVINGLRNACELESAFIVGVDSALRLSYAFMCTRAHTERGVGKVGGD